MTSPVGVTVRQVPISWQHGRVLVCPQVPCRCALGDFPLLQLCQLWDKYLLRLAKVQRSECNLDNLPEEVVLKNFVVNSDNSDYVEKHSLLKELLFFFFCKITNLADLTGNGTSDGSLAIYVWFKK